MTYSNALPIQFWPVDEDTFNELEVCGITHVCWCQPIQMDDPIMLQFQAETGGSYEIWLYDEDGNQVGGATPLLEIGTTGVYEGTPLPFPTEGKYQIQIHQLSLTPSSPDEPGTPILKSDCLDVRVSHPCTNVITYRNSTNAFGLNYADASPETTFAYRVRSVFFHEEPFDESEDHELSSDTMVQIWAKLERKRQFEIDFMPYYSHEKLRLILAHQQVEVNSEEWIKKKDDAYTIVRTGNKHYPLNKATVLLTDKNFIKRNLL